MYIYNISVVCFPVKLIHFYVQEFGHQVRLATHINFSTFVKSAGIDFYPLGGDPRILAGCKMSLQILFLFLTETHFVFFMFPDFLVITF